MKAKTSFTHRYSEGHRILHLVLQVVHEQRKFGGVNRTHTYSASVLEMDGDEWPIFNDDASHIGETAAGVVRALRMNNSPMPCADTLANFKESKVLLDCGKKSNVLLTDTEKVSWVKEHLGAMLGEIIAEVARQKAAADKWRAKSALKRDTAKAKKATEKVAKTTKKLSAEKAEAEAAIAALTARLAELNRAETAADCTPDLEDDDDDDESYDSFDPNYDDGGDYKDHTDA
jgi:predicted phage tail protein